MRALILLILAVLVAVPAMAGTTATPTFNVSWEHPGGESLAGFTLYKDGAAVCPTTDPTARQLTCTIQIENKPIIFTLSADSKYGAENNAMSAPVEFTPAPGVFEDLAQPGNLQITIPITINVTVQ